jgi:hypothetical protein
LASDFLDNGVTNSRSSRACPQELAAGKQHAEVIAHLKTLIWRIDRTSRVHGHQVELRTN